MTGNYLTEKDMSTLRDHLNTIDRANTQLERQRAERAEGFCEIYERAFTFFRTEFPHDPTDDAHAFANKILDMVGK